MKRRVGGRDAHLDGVREFRSKDVEGESGRKVVVRCEFGEGRDELGVFLWTDALNEELDVLEEDFRRLKEETETEEGQFVFEGKERGRVQNEIDSRYQTASKDASYAPPHPAP